MCLFFLIIVITFLCGYVCRVSQVYTIFTQFNIRLHRYDFSLKRFDLYIIIIDTISFNPILVTVDKPILESFVFLYFRRLIFKYMQLLHEHVYIFLGFLVVRLALIIDTRIQDFILRPIILIPSYSLWKPQIQDTTNSTRNVFLRYCLENVFFIGGN